MTTCLYEYCAKCQTNRNLYSVRYEKEEVNSDGKLQLIITLNYHCEDCQSFVRSEEEIKIIEEEK